MDFFIFIWIFAASPAFGENGGFQQQADIDRARSAWNFGGRNLKRGVVWSRPRNSPGPVIADRRYGYDPLQLPSPPKQPLNQLKHPVSPRKSKPRLGNPANAQNQRKSPKPSKKSNKPQKTIPAKIPKYPASLHDYLKPLRSSSDRRQSTPKKNPWHRAARRISSRGDSLMKRFRKEDLWHLDKGEGYPLRNADIEKDHHLRARHQEHDHDHDAFEHDDEENEIPDDHDHHHHLNLEHSAEAMVNHAEKGSKLLHHAEPGKGKTPHHVHHHHHYQPKKNDTKPAAKPKPKHPDPSQLTPAILPRIHNPIPLGCLLAVPVFHPIRPRNHMTCLLSIPGTPNLMKKRRRRRSADLKPVDTTSRRDEVMWPRSQPYVNVNRRQFQTASRRKYYPGYAGGSNNFKLPATIVSPPRFKQSDVLNMLLGSGGVKPTEMGKILMANNHYVRMGRGLLNSGSSGTRSGRTLWGPVISPGAQGQLLTAQAVPSTKQNISIHIISPQIVGADIQQSDGKILVLTKDTQPSQYYPPQLSQESPSVYSDDDEPAISSYNQEQALTEESNVFSKYSLIDKSKSTTSKRARASGASTEWKPISKINQGQQRTMLDDGLSQSENSLESEGYKTYFTKVRPHYSKQKSRNKVKSSKVGIDTTDLAAVMGYKTTSDPMSSKSKQRTQSGSLDLLETFGDPGIIESVADSIRDIKFAVKNEFLDGIREKGVLEYSFEPDNGQDLSQQETRVKVKKIKYPQRKRVPDPIYVRVPKDK